MVMIRKLRWSVFAILVGVLALGIGLGVVGTIAVLRSNLPEVPPPAPRDIRVMRGGGRMVDRVLDRMDHRLNLSAEQREAIRGEMTQTAAQFGEIHRKTRVELDALFAESQSRIEKHLNAEQIEAYRKYLEERQRWHPSKGDRFPGRSDRMRGRDGQEPSDWPHGREDVPPTPDL
ncbi:MAG: hypothetical protein BWY82_01782 [Verrucomicrobia bacterium ADurb.Bin474]|nr:MAG: hypothetical protein BWY82_01782 [Verrucomicrobia bacterium ADurb.Bin474]